MIFSLKATTRSISTYPLKHFPNFPSIEFLWSTHSTWMITSLEWAASALFNGNFYKDCLGLLGQLSLIEPPALIPLSWGIMTPNLGRFPPAIVGSGLRMLFSLHPASSTNLTSKHSFNNSPKLLSPPLFIYNKIFRITLNILDLDDSSITT